LDNRELLDRKIKKKPHIFIYLKRYMYTFILKDYTKIWIKYTVYN